MAQGLGQGLREHPYRVDWQQGGHQGQEGEGQVNRVPQKEEPPVLRHLRQVQLQLREALPLVGQEVDRRPQP